MAEYRLSQLAEDDLAGIWFYTFENWSAGQADTYHRSIIAIVEALAEGTRTGRQTELRAGLLKHPAGRHMVYYRQTETGIDVIRILHQSMDIDRHL